MNIKGPFVATVEMDGPFKIETKPHAIAAKEVLPVEVPATVEKHINIRQITIAIIILVILAGVWAVGRKKSKPANKTKIKMR